MFLDMASISNTCLSGEMSRALDPSLFYSFISVIVASIF